MVNFKKLIPSNMRTNRWGEFIEAIQSLMTTIKTEKVDIIKTQFMLENMTASEKLNLGKSLGYDIDYRDGYTSSSSYLNKELITIVSRILLRTTEKGYNYIFYIYNLKGEVLTTFLKIDYLLPLRNYEQYSAEDITLILNREADNILYYIGVTPIYSYPISTGKTAITLDDDTGAFDTLDMESSLTNDTRHLILRYYFKYIENSNEFISLNTAKAFYKDIYYHKRATEIVYFQPVIDLYLPDVGNTESITYLSEDGIYSAVAYFKTIADIHNDFIQLGKGTYTDVSILTAGSRVNDLVQTYLAEDILELEEDSGETDFTFYMFKLFQKDHIDAISEIAYFLGWPAMQWYSISISNWYDTGLTKGGTYYFKLNINGGGWQEFNITTPSDIPAVNGSQEVVLTVGTLGTDLSGLLNSTTYYFLINDEEYSITTGTNPTYNDVVSLLDTELDGNYSYQELGLSVDRTAIAGFPAAYYTFKFQGYSYSTLIQGGHTWENIRAKIDNEIGADFTVSWVGTDPNSDIRITANTKSSLSAHQVNISDGDSYDTYVGLFTYLGHPPESAIDGHDAFTVTFTSHAINIEQDIAENGYNVDIANSGTNPSLWSNLTDFDSFSTSVEGATLILGDTGWVMLDSLLQDAVVNDGAYHMILWPSYPLFITTTLGNESTIEIDYGTTGTDLFTSLTGFSYFDTPIDGLMEMTYYATFPKINFSKEMYTSLILRILPIPT